jgi:hypothetical protein
MEYKGYDFQASEEGGTMLEDEYIRMIDILEEYKPNSICELGSGQSTKIFEKYCSKFDSKFYSIEHDYNWKYDSSVIFPLIDEETCIKIGEYEYDSCNKYDGFEGWLEKQDKFDLILIDGPYGCGFRLNYKYSRIQILSFVILNKISDNAIVMYHDSERENAKATLNEFENLLRKNRFSFVKEKLNENKKRELTIYKINKNGNNN